MAADSPLQLSNPRFRDDPYPLYARLRQESPVCSAMLPNQQVAWLVTRYDDVAALLRDTRFAKNPLNARGPDQAKRQPWMPRFAKPLTRNMLDLDPPDHTSLRALVHKAFTPKVVEDMRTRIEGLTEAFLDRVRERGSMDLIRDYARPLPTTVIAEMLGIPAGDHLRFHRWSAAIVAVQSSRLGMVKGLPALFAFLRYIRKLVRRRRKDPQEDLVSRLIAAEEAGDKLDEDELVAMIFLLLVAGFETTVNLIGNGTLALLENPGQMESLRRRPEQVETAVEELLRFDGPLATATERYAREDVSIGDATIPQGALVYAVLGSANRDERQFKAPDRLDLQRSPNRHLAFGQGIHYCLGAPLARLEGQIAINTLLRRLADLRLGVPRGDLRWRPGPVLRGLQGLPVNFRAQ